VRCCWLGGMEPAAPQCDVRCCSSSIECSDCCLVQPRRTEVLLLLQPSSSAGTTHTSTSTSTTESAPFRSQRHTRRHRPATAHTPPAPTAPGALPPRAAADTPDGPAWNAWSLLSCCGVSHAGYGMEQHQPDCAHSTASSTSSTQHTRCPLGRSCTWVVELLKMLRRFRFPLAHFGVETRPWSRFQK